MNFNGWQKELFRWLEVLSYRTHDLLCLQRLSVSTTQLWLSGQRLAVSFLLIGLWLIHLNIAVIPSLCILNLAEADAYIAAMT